MSAVKMIVSVSTKSNRIRTGELPRLGSKAVSTALRTTRSSVFLVGEIEGEEAYCILTERIIGFALEK